MDEQDGKLDKMEKLQYELTKYSSVLVFLAIIILQTRIYERLCSNVFLM